MRYWNRNLISATARRPTSSESSGIFDLRSYSVYADEGIWPKTYEVVTNGLVLYLDAGNSSSYSGSGTAWSDLSDSGNDGTLTNGPTFDSNNSGAIVFDGTNDYVDVSGSETLTAATFLTWIRRSGEQTNYAGILFSRSTVTSGMNFRGTSEEVGYHWNNDQNTYNWSSGLTVPNAEWCMIAVTVTSSIATAYLFRSAGTTSATNSVSHSSSTLDNIKVGADQGSGRYFDGRISVAMLYDRALSQSELTSNYNAFKSRYGY